MKFYYSDAKLTHCIRYLYHQCKGIHHVFVFSRVSETYPSLILVFPKFHIKSGFAHKQNTPTKLMSVMLELNEQVRSFRHKNLWDVW